MDGFCDIIGHRLVQFHPAVHHNAAVPEVENLQLLESSQVGLQVRQKLRSTGEGGRKLKLISLQPVIRVFAWTEHFFMFGLVISAETVCGQQEH